MQQEKIRRVRKMHTGMSKPKKHKYYLPLWTVMHAEGVTTALIAEWIGVSISTVRNWLCRSHGYDIPGHGKAAIAEIFAPKYSYEELFPEEKEKTP